MPRLLLIAYGCPPRIDAGSIRPAGLMKYLPRFGWEVTVLTAQLPDGPRLPVQVIETGYRDVIADWKSRFGLDPQSGVHDQLRLPQPASPTSSPLHTKLLEAAKWMIAYPDPVKGWIPFAVETLPRLKAELAIDAIVSTSPPASAHIIGAHARRVLNRPWIADFRDLWAAQNYWGARRLMQPFYKRLERKTLRSADALVTVSSPWAQRLKALYPGKPVYTITNGFDPDDFHGQRPPLTKCLSITHAGYLYEGKRDPTLLFDVLRDMIAEQIIEEGDIQVRFYGPREAWLQRLLDHYRLQRVVNVCGVVPRTEALQREAESQVLLLLGWSDPRETGQHTGKLFEYFGAARPILAVGGTPGVLTETLRETRTGVHAWTKEQLRGCLLRAYEEFRNHGSVTYHPDEGAVGQYTHLEMARKFAEVLNRTTEPCSDDRQVPPRVREDAPASVT